MSKIKPVPRFTCGNGGYAFCQGCYEMSEDEDGNYIQFSDYEAMKAGCAKLLSEQDYQYNNQTNELIVRHSEQVTNLAEELRITDSLLEERNKLLRIIPECEVHGECVPHAVEWVTNAQAENKQLKEKLQIRDNQVASKKAVIEELEIQNNHLQFLLDSVMLEYCPDEMIEAQMENWKKAQRAIDTADPEYYKSDTYKNNVKFSVDMIK